MLKNLTKIFIPDKPLLGRWLILNKDISLKKLDMANEDHCGTCSNDKNSIFKTKTIKGEPSC